MKALDIGNITVGALAIIAWAATIITGHSDPTFSTAMALVLGASGGHGLTRAVS